MTAIRILLLTLVVPGALSLPAPSPTAIAKTHCGQPADIIFAIDSSSSIWIQDFRMYALPFMKNMSDIFDVGPDPSQIRVGAMTFSTEIRLEFNLKDFTNRDSLMSAFDRIQLQRGQTHTHKALQFIDRQMFTEEAGARPGVPHIIIVLTDGASSKHKLTIQAAQDAKAHDITIFAIGVGHASDSELDMIASSPPSKFKFKVTEFSALDRIMLDLAIKTCEVRLPPTTTVTTTPSTTTEDPMNDCGGTPADLFFILDSSGSIWKEDFDLRVLAFLRGVVSGFSIGQDKTRVGVITFSDLPKLVIGLDDYHNKQQLLRALTPRVVQYMLGGTNTAAALRNLRMNGFHESLYRGQEVKRIAIVITDGQSWNEAETKKQAEMLKANGVMVYAIGVGKGVKQEELEAMANEPVDQFVFSVDDFSALSELKDVLAATACGGEEERMSRTQPRCGDGSIEMTFAFDATTMGNPVKHQVVKNVQFMNKRLASLEAYVKIGINSGNCPTSMNVKMTSPEVAVLRLRRMSRHITPRLHSIVKSWRHGEKSKDRVRKFQHQLKVMKGEKSGVMKDEARPASRGLVVLLSRENMSEWQYLVEETKLLLQQGIQVFAILDESVGQFQVGQWQQLLGSNRVLSHVGTDYDFSGHMMEFMCSL